MKRVLGILALLTLAFPICAAELLSKTLSIQPRKPTWIVVHIPLAPGWHTYGADPGEAGMPPEFKWHLPNNTRIEGPFFEPTTTFQALGMTQKGYEHEANFKFKLTTTSAEPCLSIQVEIKYLICKDLCKPENATLSLRIPVSDNTPLTNPQTQGYFKENATHPFLNLLIILGSAFLGGLILNLMPCVLPVLSLKLLQKAKFTESLCYTGGILSSFWILGGALIILKAFGHQVGWGFQLQSPVMLIALALLFFGITLNLLDLFEFGLMFTRIDLSKHHRGNWGAFATGVLTTLVATPCAAPFVGSAIGIALLQPSATSFGIFTALALGLASPYFVLSLIPGSQKLLPKPGPWFKTFKRILAIPMFLTTIWLLSLLFLHSSPQLKNFQPYSAKAVAEARQKGPVFIDFGADWCLTCQYNEKTTLQSPKIVALFKQHNVQAFKADWTHQDPEITKALAEFKRNSVPLYVYYPKGKPPVILPEILSVSILEKALY